MKFLSRAFLLLAFAPLALADTFLFDDPADLDRFNVQVSGNQTGTAADYTATGGLAGSGAVQMNPAYVNQSWIAQNGLVFAPGVDFTVSAFLKLDSYAGIGFTSDANAATGALYPDHSIMFGISGTAQFLDLNSTGTDSAGDEGFWDSSGELQNIVSSPAAYDVGDWVYLSLSIRFDGSSYTATYSATLSDANGALGDAIMEGVQIFGNGGLSSSGMLHPFFYFDGGYSSPTIDTFTAATAAVPEPSTTALILGGAVILCAIIRRRRA